MIKKIIKKCLNRFGYEITRKTRNSIKKDKYSHPSEYPYPIELSNSETQLIDYVVENKLTLVSRERLFATLLSCKYVCENNIEGDFVECGVWKGGNSIIAAGVFKMFAEQNRKVWLYDTFCGFDGLPPNNSLDFELVTQKKYNMASKKFQALYGKDAEISIERVKNNFHKIGLLSDNVIFVEGDINKTLELNGGNETPQKIAVLRLDTDWYESTKKEMCVLYPKISPNGILMVDDYGHVAGHKQAIDEYFRENGNKPFLQYIDYAGRLAIKTL